MKVKVSDEEYLVNFYYLDSQPIFIDADGCDVTGVVTRAIVRRVNGETLETVAYGSALCNPMDNFSKEVGRKIALTRALQVFEKNDRQEFWNNYWSRSPRTLGRMKTV